MGKTLWWTLAATAALGLAATGLGAEQAEETPKPEAPAAQVAAPPAQDVEMVVITLAAGGEVRGRLIGETDEAITVETPGGGSIGYRKENVQGVQRFTLPAYKYQEEVGDWSLERAWKAEDAPTAYSNARRAYRRAAGMAPSEEERTRLNAKLDAAGQERDEWQQKALLEIERQRATHEAELARVQAELAQEQLSSARRSEQTIQSMVTVVQQLQDEAKRLALVVEQMERRLDALEDDVNDLQQRGTVVIELRREHGDLARRVERIEQRLPH